MLQPSGNPKNIYFKGKKNDRLKDLQSNEKEF